MTQKICIGSLLLNSELSSQNENESTEIQIRGFSQLTDESCNEQEFLSSLPQSRLGQQATRHLQQAKVLPFGRRHV